MNGIGCGLHGWKSKSKAEEYLFVLHLYNSASKKSCEDEAMRLYYSSFQLSIVVALADGSVFISVHSKYQPIIFTVVYVGDSKKVSCIPIDSIRYMFH